MEILPQDVQREILSRVPIKSLLRFKCVCRAWQALIEDPSFANLHLSRSKHNSTTTILTYLQKETSLLLLDLDFAIDETNPPHYKNVNFIQHHRLQFHPDSDTSLIVSCNGLLCFPRLSSPDILCVGNPITGEYISLPSLPPLEPNMTCYHHGIGFDSTTGEYKVVVICSNLKTLHAEAAICSLKGSLSWRFLRGIPSRLSSCEHKGLFVDGALYWWMDILHSSIIAMDMRREKFHVINLPEDMYVRPIISTYPPQKMIEREGCLGVFTTGNYRGPFKWGYDIRVLKGYPPKEEGMETKAWFWTEVVFSDWDIRRHRHSEYYNPIFALRNGDVLIVDSSDQFVLHNLESTSFICLKSFWPPKTNEAFHRQASQSKKGKKRSNEAFSRMLIYEPSLVRIGI